MGTSKGYAAPTGGQWTKLKRDVSRFARDVELGLPAPSQPDPRIGNLLAQLVAVLGGAAALSRAAGVGASAGSGSPVGIGAAAARTGAGLGGFASTVAGAGLDEALHGIELGDLADRPADEVVDAIVERLSEVPAGLDEAAAREALILLLAELQGDAATLADLETAYKRAAEAYGVRGLMVRYFGYYLYVLFCERFTERLNRDPERAKSAAAVSSQIREYVLTAVEARLAGTDVGAIDWTGPDGLQMSEEILGETLEIFGAPA